MRSIDTLTGEFEVLDNFSRLLVPINVRRERVFYVEVGYQALKTTDHAEFMKITETNDPREAKKLGQKVKINPKNWDLIKPGIMYSLLELKFYANPTMARILASTGKMKITEGNTWHDNYWGDCHCNNTSGVHPECLDPGRNMLGKLLMRVRTEVRSFY